MSYARQMLDSYPRDFNVDAGVLPPSSRRWGLRPGLHRRADDCLSGAERSRADQVPPPGPGLRRCVHGHATGGQPPHRVRRQPHPAAAGGVAACRSCGDECERHAQMHEHCRVVGIHVPAELERHLGVGVEVGIPAGVVGGAPNSSSVAEVRCPRMTQLTGIRSPDRGTRAIRYPQPVGRRRGELTVDQIRRRDCVWGSAACWTAGTQASRTDAALHIQSSSSGAVQRW